MKKILLSMLAVVSAGVVLAQPAPTATPPAGNLDLSYVASDGSMPNTNGLAAVTINVTATINRECEGVVVLKRDGEILTAIPASNKRKIVCIDGFEQGDIQGTPMFIFYPDAKSNQANVNGQYQVVVPAGLYFNRNDEPNKAFVLNYNVYGGVDEKVQAVVNPANLAQVESLSKVTITYTGALGITVNNPQGVYYMDPYAISSGDESEPAGEAKDIYPDISVSGNVVTLTLKEPFAEKCNAHLTVEEGAFSIKTAKGETINESLSMVYQVTGKQLVVESDMTVTPVAGTYEEIPATNLGTDFPGTGNNWYGFFRVELPKGATIANANAFPYVYIQNADGERVSTRGDYQVKTVAGSKYVWVTKSILKLSDDSPLRLSPGTYYLEIPANTFYFIPEGETSKVGNKEIKYGPYVFEAAMPEYTISPEPGEVTGLSEIAVAFDADANIEYNRSEWVQLTNLDSKIVYDLKPETVENDEGYLVVTNPIVYKLTSELVPGNYEFRIPSGALSVNGMPIEISCNYKVVRAVIQDVAVVANGEPVVLTFVPLSDEDDPHWSGAVSIENGQPMEIQFELPFGYNELYYFDNSQIGEASEKNIAYIPAADLQAAGFALAVDNKVPVIEGMQRISFAYGVSGDCTEPTLLELTVNVSSSGIAAVEAAEGEAEYYTLQGVKVAAPANGLFIRVANGKAQKVLVK